MTTLRVVIVDDEAFARQRLRRLLGEQPDVEVVGEASNGREAVTLITTHDPDVVLLDVQMPRVDGFGVLRALDGPAPLVIFVTAFDEHAVAAFNVHAFDYILKPVDPARFADAIERARTQIARTTAAERHAKLVAFLDTSPGGASRGTMDPADIPNGGRGPRGAIDRLLVKDEGRMYFVPVNEIDWIEAYGNYARVHTGPHTHLIRETMATLERALDVRRFARIHRSTIVNLDRVKQMDLWGSGDYMVRLADGTQLKLSRWYRDRLEARMKP
ncbi:MAG TPA: LytTR family DNA-binding domain-containing protein [Gemmatimonadaceae bacterium]|nr:LytTR family DNA-binding domain-containing protein [Gemmatimonadaceae bacterium]